MPYKDYERQLAHARAYYLAHRAEQDARHIAWSKANPESKYRYGRRWVTKNPETAASYYRKYRLGHLEKVAAAMRDYRRRKPEIMAAVDARHRAKRLGAPGLHTAAEWRDKLTLFAGCCIYCGESKPLTRDHKIPLARGGTDNIENIVPACKSCNGRKRTRTAQEFIALRIA